MDESSGEVERVEEPRPFNPWLVFEGLFIPNWLLVRPELTLTAKVLLVALDQVVQDTQRPADARVLLQRLGVPHLQAVSLLSELERNGLLQRSEEGWVPSVPPLWADPTYEHTADGQVVYTAHEPGQWWMGNEGLCLVVEEDDGDGDGSGDGEDEP